eukprot:296529_1
MGTFWRLLCCTYWTIIQHASSQSNYVWMTDRVLQMSDADAFCSFSYGTSLASIHNESQNDEAYSKCKGDSNHCWIGLNDKTSEGEYTWTDGTPFDFIRWSDGEPDNNNARGDEDCARFRTTPLWIDIGCEKELHAVCNYPSRKVIVNDKSNNVHAVESGLTIGTVDILDEMDILFDFRLHSYASDDSYSNLFHIGSPNYTHFPSIGFQNNTLIATFSTVNDIISFDCGSISLSSWYTFAFHTTQTTAVASLDNIIVGNLSNISSHGIFRDELIYISAPIKYYNTAPGSLRNLKITTTNAYVSPFNYLCDYYSRFTVISGIWQWNASNCWLHINEPEVHGAIVWLGDKDHASRQWTDYKIELVVQLTSGTANEAQAGLLFRAQSVSTEENGGQQYLVDIKENTGVNLTKIDTALQIMHEHPEAIHFGTDYSIRVEAFANKFDVYLQSKYIFTGTDTSYASGSIGLKVQNAVAIFKSLRIIFAENDKQITFDPTASPIKITTDTPTTDTPTNYPSTPPITTRSPSGYPTILPSNDPSENPIRYAPITSGIKVELTISITLTTCDDSCVITEDKVNHMLIAQLEPGVQILSTEIVDNTVIISIVADASVALDKDVIASRFEAEYGESEVSIEAHESEDYDDGDTPIDHGNNDLVSALPLWQWAVIGFTLLSTAVLIGGLCRYYRKRIPSQKHSHMIAMESKANGVTPGTTPFESTGGGLSAEDNVRTNEEEEVKSGEAGEEEVDEHATNEESEDDDSMYDVGDDSQVKSTPGDCVVTIGRTGGCDHGENEAENEGSDNESMYENVDDENGRSMATTAGRTPQYTTTGGACNNRSLCGLNSTP